MLWRTLPLLGLAAPTGTVGGFIPINGQETTASLECVAQQLGGRSRSIPTSHSDGGMPDEIHRHKLRRASEVEEIHREVAGVVEAHALYTSAPRESASRSRIS